MVLNYYGKYLHSQTVKKRCKIGKHGMSALDLLEAAENFNMSGSGVQLGFNELRHFARKPCILHWNRNHFVILLSISSICGITYIKVADPAKGILCCSKRRFLRSWSGVDNAGTALLLEPNTEFHLISADQRTPVDYNFLLRHVRNNKSGFIKILAIMLVLLVIQFAFPFLTKNLVDAGIDGKNISFISLILVAQLMLVFSRSILDMVKARLITVVSARVGLLILVDFWRKIMKLPVSFFESNQSSEIFEKINDNKKLRDFLNNTFVSSVFSCFTLIVFSSLLFLFSYKIFLVFLAGNLLYILWVRSFLARAADLNHESFRVSSEENSVILESIYGIEDIKIYNLEEHRQHLWESVQVDLSRLTMKNLFVSQQQYVGALLISQLKDIFITYTVANLVVQGTLSMGTMLAVQFIIGQLNSPVDNLISFMQKGHEAKISLSRVTDIANLVQDEGNYNKEGAIGYRQISFENLSFQYPDSNGRKLVLKDINLDIPFGSTIAIVGESGSGKSTILKLLLKFYNTYDGSVKVGNVDLRNFKSSHWRQNCSAVLQSGYIFNDTFARNIAVGVNDIDYGRLKFCCEKTNLISLINTFPEGIHTNIRNLGLSQGQRQRILIARAMYKDAPFIFFDEATNALDASNEKEIVSNLKQFFRNKTVIIVAHRLSTIMHADKIVVLHDGEIVEVGGHSELLLKRRRYYSLVNSQLSKDTV